jgi:CubicO group peptidase (beta-lactamase class C family)
MSNQVCVYDITLWCLRYNPIATTVGFEIGCFHGANVIMYKNNRLILKESIGYLDEQKRMPMKESTLFRIFSNTKPITAVAIMILVDRKK